MHFIDPSVCVQVRRDTTMTQFTPSHDLTCMCKLFETGVKNKQKIFILSGCVFVERGALTVHFQLLRCIYRIQSNWRTVRLTFQNNLRKQNIILISALYEQKHHINY